MRYIGYEQGASADSLVMGETASPIVLKNQVLVRVASFGINRADILQRQGKYPQPAGESPILGLEVSGEIIEIHPSCSKSGFTIGDKVFGLVAGGGYAEYVAVNVDHIMKVPTSITLQQAGGIAECFLTAFQAMFVESDLRHGQKILVHAGASGVGLAAIQLAKLRGCQVAVTASNVSKLNMCESCGADLLINYKRDNFYQVLSSEWQGCDLIIDFVGGDYLNRNIKLLKQDGCLIYLAMLAGRYADKLDMAMMLGKRATIKASTLRNRSDEYKSQLIKQFSKSYLEHFSTAKLSPNIDAQYSAKDAVIAHKRMENNDTKGKLICSWE